MFTYEVEILTTEIRKKYTNGLYAVEYFLNNIKDVREQEEQITFYQPKLQKSQNKAEKCLHVMNCWLFGCFGLRNINPFRRIKSFW